MESRPTTQYWPIWTAFALTLSLYLLTIFPDITWNNFGGDGGELMAAAMTLGAPHPPGYPTYVWLGRLAGFLPIEPVALRFHLFSALCTASATAVLSATVLRQQHNPKLALLVGLLFGSAPLVWQQAIIAEVYSLNLLVATIWLYIFWHRPEKPFALGFWQGLALTTHLTSLMLLPLTFWRMPRANWIKVVAGIILGVLPYLTLPWLARADSVIGWGEPDTLSGWWWLVSGHLYQHQVLALPSDQWLSRLGSWLPALILNLLLVGGLFTIRLFRQREPLSVGLFLIGAAYMGYAFLYHSEDAIVFTLPGILLLSSALATQWQPFTRTAVFLPLIAVTLNLIYPVFGAQSEGPKDLRAQTIPILEKLPPDALVITPGDQTIFTLWYFQLAENRRTDLTFVDQNLFGFAWYRSRLRNVNPTLEGLDGDNWERFLESNNATYQTCWLALASDTPIYCPDLTETSP